MPRKLSSPPSYALHKASGQAVVRISGRDHYLGAHGTPESFRRYIEALAEWCDGLPGGSSRSALSGKDAANLITINGLLLKYIEFAVTYYIDETGQTTSEYDQMRFALRPLRQLYGHTFVRDFGPRALKELRQILVGSGLSRGVINRQVNRIRRVFKWAVSEELAPGSLYEALRTVTGLQQGRTTAREAPPVKPVPNGAVEPVLLVVSPQVRAMIQLQLLAAMRPCEVVRMRATDIDQGGDVWIFRPDRHKNRWRGHQRQIYLGPQCQAILKPFLDRDQQAYLFGPCEAEQQRNRERSRQRRSPMTPSQSQRKSKNKRRRPPGDVYDVSSYRRAITYGIERVNRDRRKAGLSEIPHWCPLQLRHSRATEIRARYGVEAAQLVLGHRRADVTQVYAERDEAAVLQIIREVG